MCSNYYGIILIVGCYTVKVGKLCTTGRTPGRPNVENNDLSAVICGVDAAAIKGFKYHVTEKVANIRSNLGLYLGGFGIGAGVFRIGAGVFRIGAGIFGVGAGVFGIGAGVFGVGGIIFFVFIAAIFGACAVASAIFGASAAFGIFTAVIASAAFVETMDANPDQDCLGELYMGLELGNQKNGQFFTPYHVCQMMARMSNDDLKGKIEAQGWVSVNDCACGAGATLIAFANECMLRDINYQTSVLFVAQDIDLVTGCMCYIQLSLLGCPGYVVIGNTLTDPGLSLDGRGLIPVHGENIWYTPFYFTDIWHHRRQWWRISTLFQNTAAE